MPRVEKTVFISYRRTNFPWALAIYQDLSRHDFDVFFDFTGIASGDFESVILKNVKSRAHFVVLLTPSALERCNEPGDWLRREIETALDYQRNIVPLMLESFDFGAPGIANHLTGGLEALKSYNGLRIVPDYFTEGMARLRNLYLNVPLDAVSHPASLSAKVGAAAQQAAAANAPKVKEKELTATEWFERGFNAVDPDEKIRCYSQAILLKPDYAYAFNNRGDAHRKKGDLEGALRDLAEAVRLRPDFAVAIGNRGLVRHSKGDLDGAIRDFDRAIQLKPNYADAYNDRGAARYKKGDLQGALSDYNDAIRLKPDYALAFCNRGVLRADAGDWEGALRDYNEAIRLKPNNADTFYNRGVARRATGDRKGAAADFQTYLDLGGGIRHGDQEKVEERIRRLKAGSPDGGKTAQSISRSEQAPGPLRSPQDPQGPPAEGEDDDPLAGTANTES